MFLENLKFPRPVLWALLIAASTCGLRAQPAPAGEFDTLFSDAETAFAAKDYPAGVEKLETLLKGVAENKNVPPATLEMVRFNIGLGYFLAGDFAKAEAAFTETLKQHPKGEYTSRSYLGLGRSVMLQDSKEKKETAIEPLKQAAADPKYRSEAGLALGQIYNELDRPDEAFAIYRSLMGSDVRTPQQTNAAVEVIGLLADSQKLDDLTAYLDRVTNQSGVRDAIAWYSNEIFVRASALAEQQGYETALSLFRSIPPRRQILETQRAALENQKQEIAALEQRIANEAKLPITRRSNVGETLSGLKAALELNTQALAAIDSRADLDAALVFQRGRCLYYLDRYEEALVCFRTIRTQYPQAADLEAAAYSEIFVYNQLKDSDQIQKQAAVFLQNHPNSKNIEQVALLAGGGLAKAGKWDEVLAFYADLEKKFPNSTKLDTYQFLQSNALFQLGKYSESVQSFNKFLQSFPNSELYEDALYQVAMANFIEGKYKQTLASCQDYLKRFPAGRYAGDLRYRLAYIDFRDEETDQSKKLIKEINAYVSANPNEPSAGSLLNLLGDVYTQKKSMLKLPDSPDKAIDAYQRAATSESQEDVIRYAAEQATLLLQAKKAWPAIAELHTMIMQRYPDSQLALVSAGWVSKMLVRDGKGAEAATLLADTLKESIADPANEQVEMLLEEVVKALIPKRVKGQEPDAEALFAQLNEALTKAAAGQENGTTNARIAYAGSLLAKVLKLPDRGDLLLKGMAANTDPALLSPILLFAAGEILLKEGQLDQAEPMFQRIVDRYPDSPFADAGPLGLGKVELARKDYQKAYDTFTRALEENPASSRFNDATLGKLEALYKLGKLDDAEKLGIGLLGDKSFRGEASGHTYLLLGEIFHARAATKSGVEKEQELKKANGYFVNAYARFKAFPEIAADGLFRSYEVLLEIGDNTAAAETLKILKDNPKLAKTSAYKKAQSL